MPANMISEPAGSSLKVTGSSSATVSAGPMPGSTPTAVPSSTPISANRRFIGCKATVRPWASAEIGSIGGPQSSRSSGPIGSDSDRSLANMR